MKIRIIPIGNSQGVRIPKALLEQANLGEEVDLVSEGGQIVIRSLRRPRQNWATAFQKMAAAGDDSLIGMPASTEWEASQWRW